MAFRNALMSALMGACVGGGGVIADRVQRVVGCLRTVWPHAMAAAVYLGGRLDSVQWCEFGKFEGPALRLVFRFGGPVVPGAA
eukprot:gene16225-biopygen4157